MFGVVQGGDILEERERSARETAKRPVAGFCLDGFQSDSMDQSLRTQLIAAVSRVLPEDKPRLVQSINIQEVQQFTNVVTDKRFCFPVKTRQNDNYYTVNPSDMHRNSPTSSTYNQ